MGLTNMLKLFTLQVVPSIIISNIKTISEMQRIEFWAAGWEVQTLPQCYAAPSLPPKRSLVCCTLDGGSYPRCWRLGMNHIYAGLRKQSHKSYDRHRDWNLDLRNKIILGPMPAHIGPNHRQNRPCFFPGLSVFSWICTLEETERESDQWRQKKQKNSIRPVSILFFKVATDKRRLVWYRKHGWSREICCCCCVSGDQ